MKRYACLVIVGLMCLVSRHSHAAIIAFDDKASFLSLTQATPATTFPTDAPFSLPENQGFTSGTLTFSLVPSVSTRFETGERLGLLPDNELVMSGTESFNVDAADPVFSFGFDFAEMTDPVLNNVSAEEVVDSTFLVRLKREGSPVGEFTFNRPDDQASFVGVASTETFDRVEVREIIGGIDNEFFGQFYTGTSPIPEPSTLIVWSLLGMTATGAGWWRRRRKRLAR